MRFAAHILRRRKIPIVSSSTADDLQHVEKLIETRGLHELRKKP